MIRFRGSASERMENITEIRQATKKDLTSIANFLNSAVLIHRHLDWRTTFEWLDQAPFLLLLQQEKIKAILVAVPDPPKVSWIRCFAVGQGVSANAAWEILVPYAHSVLEPAGVQMAAVCLQDWFNQVLLRHEFTQHQKIVVLEWNHKKPSPMVLPQEFTLRPMELSDLEEVSKVDALAFEPLWVNTLPSIKAAYGQALHTYVVEHNNQIIAYELSTGNKLNGHLARLAVLPEYQSRHIGRALITELLNFFIQTGVDQVTVNTQNNNLASLHLYKNMGFIQTYEDYPVLLEKSARF